MESKLELVATEAISEVGIDFNFILDKPHLYGQLSFAPGMGYNKANFLIENIRNNYNG